MGLEVPHNMSRLLRIAQVAPPFERVPPLAYGGTERVIHALVTELDRRGHAVTTFASGDSDVPGRHVPTVADALRPAGFTGDPMPYVHLTIHEVLARAGEFDLIHAHVEWASLLLAKLSPVPVVTTFHGRLDLPWAARLLEDPPAGLVAISRDQASTHPQVPWTVVHNGLRFDRIPADVVRGEALCFVGRAAPEKGILEAIEIARRSGRRLRIAAKVAPGGAERGYYLSVLAPAIMAAGPEVEFLGELSEPDRDRLFGESHATLMPGPWPEPFGLVAIESMACGTPVIARRTGALPEVVRDGTDGFLRDDVAAMAAAVDSVDGLDRAAIRVSVASRFSVERMADGYEAIYRNVLAGAPTVSAVSR